MAKNNQLVATEITIQRVIDDEGNDQVWVSAEDANGDMPPLIEMLGMIEMARDTAYEMAMNPEGGEDEQPGD
jgi:hypothetical protein